MKRKNILIGLLLLGTGLVGGYLIACAINSEGSKNSEVCRVAEESGLTSPQLQKAIGQYKRIDDGVITSTCDTVCCDSFQMCGISYTMLIDLVANYTKSNWRNASEFAGPVSSYTEFMNPNNKLDTRAISIPFEELEDYLCYLKKEAREAGKTLTNIAILPIKYWGATEVSASGLKTISETQNHYNTTPSDFNGPSIINSLPGRTSVGFVPFVDNMGSDLYWGDSTRVYLPGYSDCYNASNKNHGWSCPPPNCNDAINKILEDSDNTLNITTPW